MTFYRYEYKYINSLSFPQSGTLMMSFGGDNFRHLCVGQGFALQLRQAVGLDGLATSTLSPYWHRQEKGPSICPVSLVIGSDSSHKACFSQGALKKSGGFASRHSRAAVQVLQHQPTKPGAHSPQKEGTQTPMPKQPEWHSSVRQTKALEKSTVRFLLPQHSSGVSYKRPSTKTSATRVSLCA